jgi:hypothetical protein
LHAGPDDRVIALVVTDDVDAALGQSPARVQLGVPVTPNLAKEVQTESLELVFALDDGYDALR